MDYHNDDEQDTDWSNGQEDRRETARTPGPTGITDREASSALQDECVVNVRCEGNCEHVTCHEEINHSDENRAEGQPKTTQVEKEIPVRCHNCKEQFKDKVTMMDHKHDSDHPSKRKCNKFPDCERAKECWFVHHIEVHRKQNT